MGPMIELETERLIFRHLVPADLDALAAIQGDPEVMRYFPSGPRSREETGRDLERCIALQAEHGFSLWATLDRASGLLIGRCGLLPQHLGDRDEVEIAYLIARGRWGKGAGDGGGPRAPGPGVRPARAPSGGLDHPPGQRGFEAGGGEGGDAAGADDPVRQASVLALLGGGGGSGGGLSVRRLAGGLDEASASMMGGALAFAAMGALVHGLGSRCDWLTVALVRALMMLATAAALAKASGSELAVWRPRTLWVRSLAGSCSLVCNFYALARLPVADAVTLMNVHPLWIVLVSALIARRLPGWSEGLGVVCGLAGVVLIERPHLGGDRLAAGAALLSSASTAVAMLGLHRLKDLDSRAVVAHFAGVASLASFAWIAIRGEYPAASVLDPLTLLMLAGVGITGTIGQILLTRAYTAGAPGKVAVVGLTQVVFAMGFDVALWGRRITPSTFAGFVLVLAPTTWLAIRSASQSRGDEPAAIE